MFAAVHCMMRTKRTNACSYALTWVDVGFKARITTARCMRTLVVVFGAPCNCNELFRVGTDAGVQLAKDIKSIQEPSATTDQSLSPQSNAHQRL